jgi:hypothetical protein
MRQPLIGAFRHCQEGKNWFGALASFTHGLGYADLPSEDAAAPVVRDERRPSPMPAYRVVESATYRLSLAAPAP